MRKAGLVFGVAVTTVFVCLIFSAAAEAGFRGRRHPPCCPCPLPCEPYGGIPPGGGYPVPFPQPQLPPEEPP